MKAICVDSNPIALARTLNVCAQLAELRDIRGFTASDAALEWLESNSVGLALLEIRMPETDGISLAARIREKHPDTAILFLSEYKEYAFDAFSVHPIGYLLQPVSVERLTAELVQIGMGELSNSLPRIRVKTFGYFDLYVDGRPVSFRLAKSKEILAFLVDKQGSGVTRSELFAAVWGDRLYDRRMQKQFDVYVRSLRQTLRENGADCIMEMEKGILRVKPETFYCDAYRFYSGDSDAINAYRGEYMSSYPWASITEGILSWRSANSEQSPYALP